MFFIKFLGENFIIIFIFFNFSSSMCFIMGSFKNIYYGGLAYFLNREKAPRR